MIRYLPCLIAAGSLVCATSVEAQEDARAKRLIDSKFYLSAGVFSPRRDLSFSVDGAIPGLNDDIQISEELKLKKDDNIFSGEFGWRFSERWRFNGQHFKASDSKSAVLTSDVEWEDIVFEAGSGVRAGTGFEVNRLFLSRDFNSADHHNFGIGVGLHLMTITAFIEGQAIVTGGGTAFRSESVRTDGPLPNFGVWYSRVLSERFAMSARLDWLEAALDPYDGGITNAAIALDFAMTDYLALEFAYNYFELDVNITDSGWRGEVEIRYHGPYISLKAFW